MKGAEPVIRNISDTARWAAVYRARETERPNALFRDPLARRLAGDRGEQIAASIPFSDRHTWSWITRTYLFDQFISEQIQQGVDLVVNLAAGLDTRPYRMKFPSPLSWVEVDLPELLDYKEEILAGEKSACSLERVRLDLAEMGARRQLFDRLGQNSKKALIISEGLLIYLSEEEVGALAQDLARPAGFQRWVIDVASPGLLRLMQKRMGPHLNPAGAPFKFAPEEGPEFFTRFGWKPADVRSMLKTARRLGRLPFFMKLIALLPERKGRPGKRPWSGICLLEKN
ncbi:MAG TPA: SAM-dependent methyltransferase [Gemmataceae bacterium]|jgi:methyltransferase (TIGR00027 family)|nr:SAM-dependent methyltransferase [Gemmataceae bacterium]